MQGQRVDTLRQLQRLADERRAVFCPKWLSNRYKPASFVLSMAGRTIQTMIDGGMYVYEPSPNVKLTEEVPNG